jgi:ubiquinone/menaquinone biosynthesis C-methylase UbiE
MSNLKTRKGPDAQRAAAINQEYFADKSLAEFVEGSPHLKHAQLREFCQRLAKEAFDRVPPQAPTVLDMGAGEGMLTLPYLQWGAQVTAADASVELLQELEKKAAKFRGALAIIPGDIFAALETLRSDGRRFDIICGSSFLHHIPDYVDLCRRAIPLLAPEGMFLTIQDPLRYDTLSRATYFFDRISYFGWRILQGGYTRGIKTRYRRLLGVYRDDLPEDTAEYHVVRNGVDQLAIRDLFQDAGMECEIRPYWSTQSTLFQKLGEGMKLNNTFAVVARRRQP